MNIEETYNDLINIVHKSKIYKNEPMNKHTSFKIGGNADILIKLVTIEDIMKVYEYAKQKSIPIHIIGNGTNLLVKDNGIRGIVGIISLEEIEIIKESTIAMLKLGAGVKLGALAQKLLNEEIAGFEFASGIPGTIGGAIYMNAGAHGKEIKDILIDTTYINENGNIQTIANNMQQFEYRKSIFQRNNWIILGCTLKLEYGNKEQIKAKMQEYSQYRKEKQPIKFSSAGSTFKRGEDFITAKLIDECGLKGYKIGGAEISELHAGFVINDGNATAKDVLDLVEYVQRKVYERFNKKIELEIKVIGE